MISLPRGAAAPTAPKRARIHFLDDRNKTGATGFGCAPEQLAAQMAEHPMESNCSTAHAGHARNECRSEVPAILTQGYARPPDPATDVRRSRATRKFRRVAVSEAVGCTPSVLARHRLIAASAG
jgi:hypothetical protein